MRRADRLFAIVLELRRRPVTTAAQLAGHLEVSARTVYRDIADLVASGIPIEGEAGVGYRLGTDFELPPLMFTVAEVQALVLGARMVEAWGDPRLRTAARSSLSKVEAVLPPTERHRIVDTALYAPSHWAPEEPRETLGVVREAIDGRHRLHIAYETADGTGPSGSSDPSACSSGAARGPSPPGASCVRTTAASASTGSRRRSCWSTVSRSSRR